MRKVMLLMVVFICSCSTKIIIPFEEEKVCVKGVEYGFCGRVSDLYEDTLKKPYRYGVKK